MKRTLLATLLASLGLVSARADLIWYEGFNYPTGNLTNVSAGVWINFSGNGSNDMILNNHVLEVSATSSTFANINGKSRADDNRRPFATTSGSTYTSSVQVVYASFTVTCTNLPNDIGSYFASFYNPKSGTGGGYFGRVQALTKGTVIPNTWRLGASANASSTNANNGGYPIDLALNTPYQVVEELDPVTLDAATIWVNPVNLNQTGGNGATERHYTTADSIGAATTTPVTDYAFRQASSFGNSFFQITNLAVATSFNEAMTNIWSTNAVAPTVLYQPAGLSNFVGAPISLSAVANGQGLGELTYQWQKSASSDGSSPSPVSNPNGNSNVLAIASAQTTDTGYYTLVVTTPYGLSATSSIAHVVITQAPVPPIFVTQPVSQTVYRGQSVTFSASVISPGNVTFTWYSNNVVVTDGVNSSADSTSLQISGVTTNASGTYKVAATNDVVVNGVVSTNAVLTVRNPQTVTIAYLRTLVDPGNGYNPTNSPPTIPYQVTGTVTTYTNLTTGNTSSYYLQDGTAGINIFVTGDSSFRPAQGAVVTYVGVLSGFSTGLELYADVADNQFPYTSYVDTGTTNALPTPISIPFDVANNLDYLNYTVQGSLVKLSDVYFGTNAGTTVGTAANTTITVTNSAGQPFNLFFSYQDLDTAGQTLPSYAYSVTGALYGHSTTSLAVAVTRFSDINTNPPPASSVTISRIAGTSITYGGGGGLQFVLLSSPSLTAPLASWARVQTNTATPGAFTIPAVGSSAQTYYSIKSE